MSTDNVSELLKEGIAAARAGRKPEARRLLEQVLELDDANEMAWMWFASIVDTPKEKRICLENVLDINPNNQKAREALAQLGPSPAAPSSTTISAPAAPRFAGSEPLVSRSAREAGRAGTTGGTPPRRVGAATAPEAAPAARRRRTDPLVFIIGGIAAVALIGLGLLLLAGTASAPTTPTPLPTNLATRGTVVAAARSATRPVTSTPAGIIVTFATDTNNTPLPTNTIAPTDTRAPTLTPTITPVPIAAYMLIFTSEGHNNPNKGIYTMSGGQDGTDVKLLFGGKGTDAFDVNVGADGRLVFVGDDKGQQQLFVSDSARANAKAITKFDKGLHLNTPVWSPDQKQIVFISDQGGSKGVYLMNADGSSIAQFSDPKLKVENRDPVFSPDGKLLVWAQDISGKKSLQLVMQPVDRSKSLTQLTATAGDNYRPTFSPDGKKIAFVSTRDRFANVYTLNMAFPTDVRLVSIGGGSFSSIDPAFAPDGLSIVFSSNRETKYFNLFSASLDGKSIQRLIADPNDNTYGSQFLSAKSS